MGKWFEMIMFNYHYHYQKMDRRHTESINHIGSEDPYLNCL